MMKIQFSPFFLLTHFLFFVSGSGYLLYEMFSVYFPSPILTGGEKLAFFLEVGNPPFP